MESAEESPIVNGIINNRMRIPLNVCYGDYVKLSDGRQGIVRYIGTPIRKNNEISYGISLSEQSGQHDGTRGNIIYWQDKPKRGTFVKPKQIATIVKR